MRAMILAPVAFGCLALACRQGEKAAAVPGDQTVVSAAPVVDPRAAIFVEKGCPQCHAIAALGVKAAAETGPDLTEAYEDVQLRFGVPLDRYLAQPTGTMQVVLTSQVTLTPAERDSMVAVLKAVWQAHEARQGHDVPDSR